MKKYNIIRCAGLLLLVILLIISFRIIAARGGEKAAREGVLAIFILVVALALLAWGYIKITAKIISLLVFKVNSGRLVKAGSIIIAALSIICFLVVLLSKAYLICYMLQCALLGTYIGLCLASIKRKKK